jgi:hypothetical protein
VFSVQLWASVGLGLQSSMPSTPLQLANKRAPATISLSLESRYIAFL